MIVLEKFERLMVSHFKMWENENVHKGQSMRCERKVSPRGTKTDIWENKNVRKGQRMIFQK